MSKRGLPMGIQMRHDEHYVDTIARSSRSIGKTISIDLIEPNPKQPRTEFGDLTELTASIKEKGVLEPLLVKPQDGKWLIIAGERRWRASKLAGLKELPCIEMDIDDQGIAEIALIENLQRKDLNIWEEADGLLGLAERFGYTQEEIAKKISKSRSTVTELMTIAGLPSDIRERCKALKITTKSGLLEVARQFDEAAMIEHLDNIEYGKNHGLESKSKEKAAAKRSVINAVRQDVADASDNVFSFSSDNNEYSLKIQFNDNDRYNRTKVHKALKQVFDAVKADNV